MTKEQLLVIHDILWDLEITLKDVISGTEKTDPTKETDKALLRKVKKAIKYVKEDYLQKSMTNPTNILKSER